MAWTVYFKYEVVQCLCRLEARKALGLCDFPTKETASLYSITCGQVSAWKKLEEKMRLSLLHSSACTGRGAKAKDSKKFVASFPPTLPGR